MDASQIRCELIDGKMWISTPDGLIILSQSDAMSLVLGLKRALSPPKAAPEEETPNFLHLLNV